MSAPESTKSTATDKPRAFRVLLGAALQKQRLRRGLTQAQLAEFADLSLKYVGEIERGEANTTLDAIERLAEAMGWNPMDALDGAREPITEGVRLLLLNDAKQTIDRTKGTIKWLQAIDPAKHPSGRLTSVLSSEAPRKGVRSRARPSHPRKPGSGTTAGGR